MKITLDDCSLCKRVSLLKKGQYPYLIEEWDECYWLLGEHQYYPGYSVLLLKEHAKEVTALPAIRRTKVFEELMMAQERIEAVFNPWKMNVCSLGNVVPHVHWHLFPRYADDALRENPPWLQMQKFSEKSITPTEAASIISKIRAK